jgi:hypothetical protein
MSAEARMRLDPFEQLSAALENVPRNHDFLAEYVRELYQSVSEEDIFRRLALCCVDFGGTIASSLSVTTASELYEALTIERRAELRRRWHENIRRESYHHDDLRARLSWRYLV